ncbi:MAG: GDP-mannose 4,6-dehydratase, partial [Ignavibacteriales bacterium]|nr:GDP-mannose 4,6-dehydratase [Ignavibacteriales bacterium]
CILDAALKQKTSIRKILIVSSQTAAGPSPNDMMITEKDICDPITTYGKSKLAQEKLVAEYFDKLPVTICRPPAVFGERDTEILIFFKTYSQGITTTIGFDRKLISLIHVKDLVEGLYLAATSDTSAGETYFITSSQLYTWDEVIDVTSRVLGKKALRFKIPHFVVYAIAAVAQFVAMFQKQAATLNIEKARDITRHAWICSPVKAKEQLGFYQKISIDKGISMTLNWYKEQGWIK